ncbi:hypothetical protein VOLCADRAFT_88176 [Volvox carteri f. nagariensis]|uniref:Uncharacterized protein n=1 Tax=Volvox carteri f. nagariensis TaxID=3068 RepID=D8TNH1_VOLCA|nr:uncharacterized protein VOLCADRAFT_88176 [Volvox carteri f. nagariensis]EFJ50839.1 hypothetical protein VOLCADRAFT_88176 [Volvox carteri f. nagariensis]|eukprot:XP_002947851.1 hypothetical protein VOLCADRAFT_88176 [Volvox carteri f. nagariensis]
MSPDCTAATARPAAKRLELFLALILMYYSTKDSLATAALRQGLGQDAPSRYRTGDQAEGSGTTTAATGAADISQSILGGAAQLSAQILDEGSEPALAAAYMDSLLADPVAARRRLLRHFTKRSKVAVIYMCFERMEMIHRAIPAILRSEGLAEFDFFISQDGGAASIFEDGTVSIPKGTQFAYIRHPANLCTGLHHHFVKAFAFDIMGYDILLVVEEDNIIHPQALQLLHRMAQLSVFEPEIGIVSLLDKDMSPFLDAERFAAGLIPVVGHMGHLWVFGLHRVKYELARGCLRDYYDVIKGHEYRAKHLPPLREAIQALMQAKGFPPTTELSQDRWLVNSLSSFGFTKRYQTLFRFFEPIGFDEQHVLLTTRGPAERAWKAEGNYARQPVDAVVNSTFYALIEGRLNGAGRGVNERSSQILPGRVVQQEYNNGWMLCALFMAMNYTAHPEDG